MNGKSALTFPDLVAFEQFGGDFQRYFGVVYTIFHNDFIASQPYFDGLKVSAQKHPEVDGIHRTFYHITHEGDIENDRRPDLRRMERIRFPRFIISNCPHQELLVWEKTVGRDNRIHILHEAERYLIVLTKRPGYLLFWTAFSIAENHSLRKKIKEYEDYLKAKTA